MTPSVSPLRGWPIAVSLMLTLISLKLTFKMYQINLLHLVAAYLVAPSCQPSGGQRRHRYAFIPPDGKKWIRTEFHVPLEQSSTIA